MRRTGTILLSFAATIAPTIFGAQASSMMTPEPAAKAAPSVIFVGSPQPGPAGPQAQAAPDISAAPAGAAAKLDVQTRSIVVIGAPEVTDEKVAAIPAKRSEPPGTGPLVIRAGILGGASSSKPAPTSSASAPAAASQEAQAPLPADGEPKTLRDAVNAR